MHIDLQSEKTTWISAARHIRSFNEAENVLVTSNFITTGNKYQHYFCLSLPLDKQSTVETIFVFDREQMQSVSISIPEYWIGKKILFTCCKCLQLEVIQREIIYFFCRSQCHGRQRTRIFYDFNDRTLGKYIHTCESEMNGII